VLIVPAGSDSVKFQTAWFVRQRDFRYNRARRKKPTLNNSSWQAYRSQTEKHTVVGDLLVHRDVYSPQLDNKRDVLVWLPPSYSLAERRYPVLYMHDGQNLFDAATSFYGSEWQVDESMTALSSEGIEAIVVGLPFANVTQRSREYNPYPSLIGDEAPVQGEAYLAFLIETVQPFINDQFRTLTEPEYTGIAGCSLGGLISMYGFLTHPQVFGFCGCFSPVYWAGSSGLFRTIPKLSRGLGKIYLDVGLREGDNLGEQPEPAQTLIQTWPENVRKLRDLLLEHGYQEGISLKYFEDPGGIHLETAWAKRYPGAIQFWLKG
jgi:predicted alpha/beta superfamily hydrolase